MATKPRLTAPQRARRRGIRALVEDARKEARTHRNPKLDHLTDVSVSRLLDDLADVVEEYLKITANQPDE